MFPSHLRTPTQIIGELLTDHPEAPSLQAEASHCQALARDSAVYASRAFAAAQAARLAYEELRHRLDPRRLRTVDFGAGLLSLALLGTWLTLLDVIELSGPLGRSSSLAPALAGAVVWLAGAWVAALASREHRRPVVFAAAAAAILLGLLLAAMHGLGRHSVVFGMLVGVFILVLAVGAAVLMNRMECASLFVARRRWHRARAAHEAAVRTEQDDMATAAVAVEAWLGVVRTRASAVTDDEQLVHETVSLAAALLGGGRRQLPS